MTPFSSRRLWLLSALALLPLAPRARAADADSFEQLKGGVKQPEDFQRFIEGSRAHEGVVAAPGAFARGEGRAASAGAPLSRPRADIRPVAPAVAPPAFSPSGRAASRRMSLDIGLTELPARKLAAVLGLGFFLIAASMLETPGEAAPAPAPAPLQRLPSLREPPAAYAEARPASRRTDAPFIDTRMPAPTWRAISLPEQLLIERWDASREKALGLASLPEWLDARGGGDGVDVPLLQAKLRREA